MHYILRFLIPIGRISYLTDNFDVINFLTRARAQGIDELPSWDLAQYRRFERRIHMAQLIFTLQTLHTLYLHYYSRSTEWDIYVLLDVVAYIANLDLFHLGHLGLIELFGFMATLLHLAYRRLPMSMCYMVYQALVENRLPENFLPPYDYHGVPLLKIFRFTAVFMLNVFQFMVIGFHTLTIVTVYKNLQWLFTTNSFYQSEWPLWRQWLTLCAVWLYQSLCSLLLASAIFLIAHVFIFLMTFLAVQLTMLHMLFWQNRQKVVKICALTGPRMRVCLCAILIHYRRSIAYLLRVNAHFSPYIMLAFLFNIPFNCYLTGLLVYGNFHGGDFQLTVFLASIGYFIVFAMHLALGSFKSSLRAPVKPLFHIATHQRHQLRGRLNLTLSLQLQTFYTKKPYGATYWRFGVISKMSFVQFLLFYTEIILFVIMLIGS